MKTFIFIFTILYFLSFCYCEEDVSPNDVVIVIRNMDYKSSREKAEKMKANLIEQSKDIDESTITVLMLHEEWAQYSSWTIIPILPTLGKEYGQKKWIFFCEDTTEIHLKGLLNVLSKFDHSQNFFLGHGLYDTRPAIIHHFKYYKNDPKFEFPDFHTGWAISGALLKKSVLRITEKSPGASFSIDVQFEVALFLYDGGNGTMLTNIPEFCINKPLDAKDCVSTIIYAEPNCGYLDPNDVLIAVKTCELFHKNRVPFIQKQIGADAKHIRYYSDVSDPDIPTDYIGVNNTKKGHCQKLHNIIKKGADDEWKHIKWLVVIDDDTIMSYHRLLKLLACYDPNESVIMGERYGYAVAQVKKAGYEYPTGGGGMVLSRMAIDRIISEEHKCWAVDSPDDMWLGAVSRRMNTPIVHTNSFHQTKPLEYSPEILSHQYLVSFHKHTNIDPMEVYNEYLVDKTEEKETTKHGGEL